ncbi:MAG: ABC transporter ATP-binding protein/permease [Bacteroides sp.]|nr:ABC transporter ATP-binding protein/permease [Bacteroides sp.]
MSEKNKKKTKSLEIVGKTLKYFLPEVWKAHKGYFFVSLFKMLCDAVHPFVSIIVSPMIIAELLGGRDIKTLIIYVAIIALGGTAISLTGSQLGVVLEKYDEKFQNRFTEEMSKRVMELDFQHTEDKKALDQIEAARTGMSWYSGGVHGICSPFFGILSDVLKIAGSVTLIAVYAPVLFLMTAFVVAINVIIQNKKNRIEIESYGGLSKLNRVFGYYGWSIIDFRYGKDIRLYGAKDMMIEKWEELTVQQTDIWDTTARKQRPLSGISDVLSAARDIAAYLYLGILVLSGGISIPIFTQMLTAGSAFQSSMTDLLSQAQNMIKRSNYAYEYIKFMEYPAAIEKGSRHIEDKPHTIEFKNVSFTYPNTEVKALDGVSLTLTQGEHLSVVGLNGAGKTTFVKLLCRLYDPTGGEILLDGVNIKEYDYAEYMSVFSPVFQDFKLFAFSIEDNIALDGERDEKNVDRVIEQVGLKEKTDSLEKGKNTVLYKAFDENGIEPSGGEQQKIAIARALFKNSPVVILDEPTAALDPVAEYDIYRHFDSLVGGKTAIYISHRLSSCKFCDKIAVFSEGRIKEYGTHDALAVIEGGIYAEMFKAQAQYYN